MERSISAFCEEGPVPNQHLPAVCFTSAGPSGAHGRARAGKGEPSFPKQLSTGLRAGALIQLPRAEALKHQDTQPTRTLRGNHPPYPRGRPGVLGLCLKGVLNQALELLLSLPNTVRRSGMSCNHSHYQSFSSTHDVATGRVLIIFAKYYQSVFSFLAVIFQLGVMVLLQQYSQYLVLFLS